MNAARVHRRPMDSGERGLCATLGYPYAVQETTDGGRGAHLLLVLLDRIVGTRSEHEYAASCVTYSTS